MNIRQAKEQIKNTLRTYLEKDEYGGYLIPSVRQRPVLLMGPPGIGKTQIMEQIASETGTGLVSYTITHHTRQSAIGLPYIEKHVYDGEETSVTEYTMSEILASVYNLIERTGIREGILFLDEINCVSETLAPMMLQFLQCKTFGNRRLPEGWMIVAAGNPPEYNRSVRDFDVVTLDRVRVLNVEEDFQVWKEYALARGLHGAVVTYLDIRKEHFYHIENTADGLEYVTARGWEDLSETICACERLHIPVDRTVVEQFIRVPRIAKDFSNYLQLYYKYRETYHVDEILSGTWQNITEREFSAAPFDEKLSVMGLLVSRLSEAARTAKRQDDMTAKLQSMLRVAIARMASAEPASVLADLAAGLRTEQRRAETAGQNDRTARQRSAAVLSLLEIWQTALERDGVSGGAEAEEYLRREFDAEAEKTETLGDSAGEQFDHAFRFLEHAVGQGQEMVLFVTELTAGADTSWFVENFGCEAYFRNNRELLFDETRSRITQEITGA